MWKSCQDIVTSCKMENCLLLKLLSQTQKNVSEPQTGIEAATFWSPVRRSDHWATRTQMAIMIYDFMDLDDFGKIV